MFRILKTTALSAMIGLTALAGIPAAAQADGLYLNLGGHGHSRAGIYFGDDDRRSVGRYHRSDRGCSPERALNKAERMGLRRARVVDVGRRTITVRGREHGDRITVTFARERGCRVIG